MGNPLFLWAMFNSELLNYQRVMMKKDEKCNCFSDAFSGTISIAILIVTIDS